MPYDERNGLAMLYAIAAALVLVLDQGLKYFVTLKIALNEGVMQLIPGVMSLVNLHNTGMAFGFLSGGAYRWGFVAIAVLFAVGVAYALAVGKVKDRRFCWLLVLIAAGGLGNAIDRALYGYVVDMFRTEFMEFAVFYVADIFVTVCGVLLCVCLILPEKKSPAEQSDEAAPPKEQAGLVLRSKKRQAPEVPEEVKERRRTGKLYDDPAPINAADPFAEFDGLEVPPEPEAPAVDTKTPVKKSAEPLPEELNGVTVDDILKEIL